MSLKREPGRVNNYYCVGIVKALETLGKIPECFSGNSKKYVCEVEGHSFSCMNRGSRFTTVSSLIIMTHFRLLHV